MISARDLAFIGCRFVAIYFAVRAYLVVAQVFSILGYEFSMALSSSYSPQILSKFFLYATASLPLLILSLLFWFCASWVSSKITAGLQIEKSETAWSVEEALSIGFTLIGVVVLVLAFSKLFDSMLYNYLRDINGVQPKGRDVSVSFAEFFMWFAEFLFSCTLGALLIIKAGGLVRFINKIRRAGTG